MAILSNVSKVDSDEPFPATLTISEDGLTNPAHQRVKNYHKTIQCLHALNNFPCVFLSKENVCKN